MDITSFSGEHRFLSNFSACTVTLDGQLYPSVEHAYQAAKTLDTSQRWAFEFTSMTPGQAKKLGQTLTIRKDWEQVKVGIMRDLLVQKFTDPALRQKLSGTHPFYLEEGNNWGDTFWGICNGRGKNHLGKLLMDIRFDILSGVTK